jgi:hypothetical protein
VVRGLSLRRQKQFANLGHPGGALTEHMAGDGTLRRIFREPELVVRQHPMIDHHPRQWQPAHMAARGRQDRNRERPVWGTLTLSSSHAIWFAREVGSRRLALSHRLVCLDGAFAGPVLSTPYRNLSRKTSRYS